MSISDWFKTRETNRYTVVDPGPAKGDLPDGVWTKCEGCKRIVYQGELDSNAATCPHCGHMFPLTAHERIGLLADEGSFVEMDATFTSADPLRFTGAKPYAESLRSAREKSELPEAVVTGRATIDGHPCVIGAMDFRFIGASMGSVVGEKVARAFEVATAERRAVVLATASGGARMQEGMLSLMQMAKTAAAAERHAAACLPYVSILTHPTMGGVTASFAVLADVLIAEPGARIGFAGPLVIEQTIRQKLPKGFQSAESNVEHGMIDAIVPRAELRDTVALILGYLTAAESRPAAAAIPSEPRPDEAEGGAS